MARGSFEDGRTLSRFPADEAQMARVGNGGCANPAGVSQASSASGRPNQVTSSCSWETGMRRRSRSSAVGSAGSGDDRPREAELGRLLEALVHVAHGPDRAGEADLAEIDGVLGQRPAGEGGEEGRRRGEISRWLARASGRPRHSDRRHGRPSRTPQRASSTAISIARRLRVPAHHGAARRAERGGRDQGLDLDEDRPRSLHAGEDRGAGRAAVAVGEEQRRGIVDLAAARPRASRRRRSRRSGRSGSSPRARCGIDGRSSPSK